ncbi:uncharacterized protein LOC141851511 [Brevipalpus obovatus]|uniref:uncharacterized protein LOC141851511 n=1 Tax=Brevipalpus obovatus TaxID=246614 RepID=UPI003D9E4CBC
MFTSVSIVMTTSTIGIVMCDVMSKWNQHPSSTYNWPDEQHDSGESGKSFESKIRVIIPGPIQNGSSVWLECEYHFNFGKLSTVKWYKNNVEFFRFTNDEDIDMFPSKRLFHESEISVNLNQSNRTHVRLKNVKISYEGTYGCEVSIDADQSKFVSIKAEEDLRVYVPPVSPLRFYGIKRDYQHGDLVDMACVSGASRPPSILHLYINGNRIRHSERSLNFSWSTETIDWEGLTVSRINVSFPLTKENGLNDGLIQFRCESIMFQISGHSWEEVIVDETGQYMKHSSYPSSSSSSSSSSKYNSVSNTTTTATFTVPQNFARKYTGDTTNTRNINNNQWPAINERDLMASPIINGLDKRYKIGDRLTVNCSAPLEGSTPYSSYLMWMLNGKEVPRAYLQNYLDNQVAQYDRKSSPYYTSSHLQQISHNNHHHNDPSFPMVQSVISDGFSGGFHDFLVISSGKSAAHHDQSGKNLSEWTKSSTSDIFLGVSFQIIKRHFQTVDSRMRLRCVWTHAQVVNRDNVSLTLIADVRRSTFLPSHNVLRATSLSNCVHDMVTQLMIIFMVSSIHVITRTILFAQSKLWFMI